MGKGAETRASILDAALRQVSVVGLEGLTIGTLAKETGLSKSGLFAHFTSKERLQQKTLEWASEVFIAQVLVPAIALPRGEPRVRAIFDNWLRWAFVGELPGGCIFLSAAAELDDRTGPVRDHLEETQRKWVGSLARAASLAKAAGHFRGDLDCQQFAFELYGIMMSAHFYGRLLRDKESEPRARRAFESLLDKSRPS